MAATNMILDLFIVGSRLLKYHHVVDVLLCYTYMSVFRLESCGKSIGLAYEELLFH